jgi:hypothetical protein
MALSLVQPGDERGVLSVLRKIQAGLPPRVALLVGGAGAQSFQAEIESAGVHLIDSLAELRAALQRIAERQA